MGGWGGGWLKDKGETFPCWGRISAERCALKRSLLSFFLRNCKHCLQCSCEGSPPPSCRVYKSGRPLALFAFCCGQAKSSRLHEGGFNSSCAATSVGTPLFCNSPPKFFCTAQKKKIYICPSSEKKKTTSLLFIGKRCRVSRCLIASARWERVVNTPSAKALISATSLNNLH